MVAIEHESTVWTGMSPLTETFVWPFALAPAAQLASLVGVHEQDGDMRGALSLRIHHPGECRPPSIVNTLIQTSFGRCPVGQKRSLRGILFWFGTPAHIPGFEVLKDDRLVTVHQNTSFFVQKVLSLVADMAVASADLASRFLASVAPAFLAGKRLLFLCEHLFRGAQVARVLDRVSGRERGEVQQAQVNANRFVGVWPFGLRGHLTREADVPVGPLPFDRRGLDGSLNGSVQLDLDAAQAGDGQSLLGELPARRIGKSETIVVRPALIAWVARHLPTTHAPKEIVKGLLDTTQDILQDMGTERGVLGSDFSLEIGQSIGLIVVRHHILVGMLFAPVGIVEVGMRSTDVPCLFALLQGGIVEFAAAGQLPVQ